MALCSPDPAGAAADALQLVRGQASIGDISRLRFSADYRATFGRDASEVVDGVACWVLSLVARSPQATYAAITLYASKAGGQPIRAELMSAAGRRLKTVTFGPVTAVSGHPTIRQTTFIDGLDPNRRTLLTLKSVERTATPPQLFRPEAMGLVR